MTPSLVAASASRQPRDGRGRFVEMNPSAAADFIERKLREEELRAKGRPKLVLGFSGRA